MSDEKVKIGRFAGGLVVLYSSGRIEHAGLPFKGLADMRVDTFDCNDRLAMFVGRVQSDKALVARTFSPDGVTDHVIRCRTKCSATCVKIELGPGQPLALIGNSMGMVFLVWPCVSGCVGRRRVQPPSDPLAVEVDWSDVYETLARPTLHTFRKRLCAGEAAQPCHWNAVTCLQVTGSCVAVGHASGLVRCCELTSDGVRQRTDGRGGILQSPATDAFSGRSAPISACAFMTPDFCVCVNNLGDFRVVDFRTGALVARTLTPRWMTFSLVRTSPVSLGAVSFIGVGHRETDRLSWLQDWCIRVDGQGSCQLTKREIKQLPHGVAVKDMIMGQRHLEYVDSDGNLGICSLADFNVA